MEFLQDFTELSYLSGMMGYLVGFTCPIDRFTR